MDLNALVSVTVISHCKCIYWHSGFCVSVSYTMANIGLSLRSIFSVLAKPDFGTYKDKGYTYPGLQ